jgi:hypothetical protein
MAGLAAASLALPPNVRNALASPPPTAGRLQDIKHEDIPFQYALADAFTLLDAYRCSVLGPTGPNRHMWMSGTLDPSGLAGGPSLTTR